MSVNNTSVNSRNNHSDNKLNSSGHSRTSLSTSSSMINNAQHSAVTFATLATSPDKTLNTVAPNSVTNTPNKKRSHILSEFDTGTGPTVELSEVPHRPSKKQMDVQIDTLVRSDTDDNDTAVETEVFDSNFFDLLSQFTQLDLPSTSNDTVHDEACPICNNKYALHEFATHVYTCIKSLDDVERNELINLDAKLARKIAESDETIALQGSLADIDDHCQESKNEAESSDTTDSSALADDEIENDSLNPLNDTTLNTKSHTHDMNDSMLDANQLITNTAENELDYKHTKRRKRRMKRLQLANNVHTDTGHSMCPAGKSCTRTDATHFLLLQHPDVNCPICNVNYAVYEIEGHVVQCLTSERPTRQLSANSLTFSSRATTSTASPILQSPDINNSVTTFQLPPHQETNTHNNTSTLGTSTIISRNRSSPSLPLAPSSDSEDERSSKYRGNKNPLNIYQATAMAHLVLAQRDKTPSQQDYSLTQLLSTFKSLGFDRENLTNILQSHSNQSNSNNDTGAVPSAFTIESTAMQPSSDNKNTTPSTQTSK